jgi:hypothetical protein
MRKEIPSFPDYEADDLGNIYRRTDSKHPRWRKGMAIKPALSANGYHFIGVTKGDKRFRRSVHSLVCEAFHGPKPTKEHEVAHFDGDKINNRVENLRWATRSENHADKKMHGTRQCGQKNGNSRLSDAVARQIFNDDGTQTSLAQKYGVSQTTVWRIKREYRHF